jgi:hypothetical protein
MDTCLVRGILACFLATTNSCATFGKKLTDSDLKKITLGKTRATELVKIAGTPLAEQDMTQQGSLPKICGLRGAPVKLMTFSHQEGNPLGGFKFNQMSFYLDKHGVVCHSAATNIHAPGLF